MVHCHLFFGEKPSGELFEMMEKFIRVGLSTLIYSLMFVMGAAIFSFLNVVIYRVPRNLNFITGRSECTHCGHVLAAVDMVPILGWFLLHGRCSYCKAKISFRYVLVELLGGALAVGCICFYGWNLRAAVVFAFFAVLTVVAFVDIDTMEIPNGFVIAAFIVGVCSIFIFPEISLLERIIGIVSVSVPLFIITIIIPGAFGGGDIKLMAACGVFLGWKLSLISLFLAILSGGIYGIILLARRKKGRKDYFAFGPFLCSGMMIGFLWGESLLNWYLSFWF